MHRIEVENLVRLPSIHFFDLSFRRDRLAFYANYTRRNELYVLDLKQALDGLGSVREDSPWPQQVSRGQVPRSVSSGFVWDRTGDWIIFARDRDGDEQHNLYKLHLASGTVEPLTDTKAQHYPGRVSPDNRKMLVMSNRCGQMNVFILDLQSQRIRQITHFSSPALASDWSPDGRYVFVTANESSDLRNQDVYQVEVPVGEGDRPKIERVFSSGEGYTDGCGRVSPDGCYLALHSNSTGFVQPGVLNLFTGETRFLGDGSGDEYPGDFSPDGAHLLTLLLRDARTYVVQVRLSDGARTVLPTPPGVVSSAHYLWDGRVLFSHTDTTHRRRLLVLDPKTGNIRVLVDAVYGKLSPDDFVSGRYVSFTSDGLTIHGILYKPEVTPGQRLPAVVWVHGGPTGIDLLRFDPFVQLIVNRGFAVLQVNYRGSTGYGRVFQEMNIGDIGGGDARDVAAGARFLAQDPEIDPGRILCGGISYGGYMTYRQLTHFPELWAGGFASVGITDWKLLYDQSMDHFKHYLSLLFEGDPESQSERYREASPIHEVHRLRAPLMMVHGKNDPRCPIDQARRFRERLEELGKVEGRDFFYYELSEQGHFSTDMEEQLASFRLLETFLARFSGES